MKVRNGFVSNSSSSSFLVGYEKVPKTIEEVKKTLFDKETLYYDRYKCAYYEDNYDLDKVADAVLNEQHEIKDVNELAEFLESHCGNWDEERLDRIKISIDEATEIFKNNDSLKFCTYTFGDEDGDFFGALEHGDLFRRVWNMRYSNH